MPATGKISFTEEEASQDADPHYGGAESTGSVSPRKTHPCRRRCCYRGCCTPACTAVALLALLVLFVAVVLIGAEAERPHFEDAPDTSALYQTDLVCGLAKNGTGAAARETLDGSTEALPAVQADYQVMNCGACGECSTVQDVDLYRKTKDTLTDTATECAVNAFLGRSLVEQCFAEAIGFTQGCERCWVDNVMCDLDNCKWTCLKMILSRQRKNKAGGDEGELNDCLKCDERICGPPFFACAGANRRTSGVVSDIGRKSFQNCNKTTAP